MGENKGKIILNFQSFTFTLKQFLILNVIIYLNYSNYKIFTINIIIKLKNNNFILINIKKFLFKMTEHNVFTLLPMHSISD